MFVLDIHMRQRIRPVFYLVLLTFLLSSCSANRSATPIPSSGVQGQYAATSVPLSEVNLDNLLLLPGDLPSEYIGQQISHTPPGIFESIQGAAQVAQEPFKAGSYTSDGIAIFLFSSPSDLDTAYKKVNEIISSGYLDPLPNIGEKAMIQELGQDTFDVTSVQVVFTRCHALVYFQLFASDATKDVATGYAQKLDARLSSVVCG